MLITTEPKITFQLNADQTKAFHLIVGNPVFHEAIHKSIAELTLKGKPTAEELEGVRKFLDVLLNLGEKSEPRLRDPFVTSIAAHKPQPKQ